MVSDVLNILKSLGFTPGAYGIYGILAFVAVHFMKEWSADRRLSVEDRQAKREGFTRQLDIYRQENRQLLDDQSKLRKEYDDYRRLCQMETDHLREMLIAVQGELAGYKRRVDTLSMIVAQGPQNGPVT